MCVVDKHVERLAAFDPLEPAEITFAVEAMLTTFIPPGGHVLMLINGAYGHRAKKILDIAKRKVTVHETPEDTPPDLAAVERMLKEAPAITHIFCVHCETTSGVLLDCRCGPWKTSRGLLCASIGTFCSQRGPFKLRFEARPRRPAFDRDIDIGRIDVEPTEAPSGPLRCHECRSRTQKEIKHKIPTPRHILNRVSH